MFLAYIPPDYGLQRMTIQGKVAELRAELNSGSKKDKNFTQKKIALKKIVANMTMSNNEMVSLFPDVLLILGKLFKDASRNRDKSDSSPTTGKLHVTSRQQRALALRTMSYVHVREFVEATVPLVKRLLRDADPYVRKTAAYCVAKLYDHDKLMVEQSDLIDRLNQLLRDDNPTVVASALASLMDIWERSETIKLTLDYSNASKMVAILPDCSEWGQTYILEALMSYVPQESGEATLLAERIAPRLSHTNSAVQRGLKYSTLHYATLYLSFNGGQMSYATTSASFFCKYNDPIYVKVTKLELIFMLANEKNIDEVLTELREYATEVDVHFVRKAVRAIGKLAIKIEPAARRCINLLLELVSTKVPYIVQEATVVIRNIFRKYPNQYESIIGVLCEHLDSLDEPEAKAAMVWVIGQYADRIENSDALLEDFLYSFAEEPVEVQLALLTATVKLFIQRPTKGQDLVPRVLKWATEETDNPDLRDRAYMYWRLLSTDVNLAKQIVMGEKPPITAESEKLDPQTLEEMCLNVGTLATIYLKPVQTVFRSARPRRLADSPALQKRSLPTSQNLPAFDANKSLSMFGMGGQAAVVRPGSNPAMGVGGGAGSPGNENMAGAVSDADAYFAGVGSQRMEAMGIHDDGFGGGTGNEAGYVVNQFAPQQVLQPAQGHGSNGDLLML
ncbi:hypothetical protein E0Z10_g6193 [Xylaria hypoxylon]|uniref:AP complex subunit beta n=1 Tax=Xylaria hypoxylon TaxID=37992 RepID=A0A4Z0YT51_9PEZI|nr:hypothetical protein E0Z10_g6193 [Xylaria hypoxylon]